MLAHRAATGPPGDGGRTRTSAPATGGAAPVAPATPRARGGREVLAAAALAAVVLGPALGPGHLLRQDLVSVPRPVFTVDTFGVGDRLPRAVPWDAVVAAVARVLPSGYPVALAALLALTLAGAGAARLARPAGPGRWIALLVAVWNPFVLEQLAIGHVPHLLGYGACPWVALAAARVVRAGPAGLPALVLAAAAGSLTPGGGLLCLGAAVAGAAAARPAAGPTGAVPARSGSSWRRRALAWSAVALLQAPWVVAGAVHQGTVRSSAGATAFAVRAESPAGVVVDVLGLGGMWAQGTLPGSRSGIWPLLATAVLLGLAAAGARAAAAFAGRGTTAAAAALAATGYAVALLPHLPGGGAVLRLVVEHVPGGGLLRDGARWLAWPALVVAVLAGHGAARLAAAAVRASPRATAGSVAAPLVVVAAAVVAVAPDLAWGLRGRLTPVTYPADWAAARTALDRSGDGDRLLVLPWQPFRRFAWAGSVPVLDPAPRALPRPALTDDALPVGGLRLPPEGPGARAVTAALADGTLDAAELSALGVGWVLVERGTPGALPGLPAPAAVAVRGADLELLRYPPPRPAPGPAPGRRLAVLAAHGAFGGLVLGAVLGLVAAHAVRRRRDTPPATGHALVTSAERAPGPGRGPAEPPGGDMPRTARGDRGAVATALAVTVAVALLGGGAAVAAATALISQAGPPNPAGTGTGVVSESPAPDVVGYGQR